MDPLEGVLHTARLDDFCRRFALRRGDLEANFDGWHKRVILSPAHAFLFPRYDEDVAQVEREAAALAALADLDIAPKLVGRWDEPDISPYPFLQTVRRSGTTYADLEDDLTLDEIACVLEQLGAATARWHVLAIDELPGPLNEAPDRDLWSGGLLEAESLRPRLADAARRLADVLPDDLAPRSSWVDVWHATLSPLTELAHVFTHGDIHETQLLVDDDLTLLAVLDWDHAGVAHPTRDFNFGEWGFGIFSWEERFDVLYERYWEAYRLARDAALPDHRSLFLYRTLSDAVRETERLGAGPSSWWSAHRLRNCALHIKNVTEASGG
jgi:aminoglycoside phosphotransferase (APT) family kinase protein